MVKELREMAKKYAPSVLCVLETQVHKSRVEGLKSTLGYDNTFAVSSSSRSGGLGIFWNNGIKIEISFYLTHSIILILLLLRWGVNLGGLPTFMEKRRLVKGLKHGTY